LEKAMHYYQFNIGDYIGHTRHLTLAEDAIYRRLLDAYYLNERPLNSGIASVARQINARDYETEVQQILEEFFQLTEEGWENLRADKEIAKYHAKSEQASKAGKASAESRSNKLSTDVERTLNENLTDEQPNTKQETRNNKHIKDFDLFWSAYPRKTAKGNAEKSWSKLKPDEKLVSEIIEAIAKQKPNWTDPKFIPHPATWLNGKRWLDGVEVTAGKQLKYWEKGYQP
jgi:uncharacterized protein YdaU (DUF1376 family)